MAEHDPEPQPKGGEYSVDSGGYPPSGPDGYRLLPQPDDPDYETKKREFDERNSKLPRFPGDNR